jgi:hypothetical protein
MLTVTVLDNRRAGKKILIRIVVSFTRMQSAANLFVNGILLLPFIRVVTHIFPNTISNSWSLVSFRSIFNIQCDQKVSVHLMITVQKVTSNFQSVPLQSPDIY